MAGSKAKRVKPRPQEKSSADVGTSSNTTNLSSLTPPTSAAITLDPAGNYDGRASLPRAKKAKLSESSTANALEINNTLVSIDTESRDHPDKLIESELDTDTTAHKGEARAKTHTKGVKPPKKEVSRIGINEDLIPLFRIQDIFEDITRRALELGFKSVLDHLNGRKLKVATMCSGTESPLLALQLVSDALEKLEIKFEVDHLFSAEIVAFKQAYIERNFNPPIIFRDITELSLPNAKDATTAYGGRAPIPDSVDLLVAGFSCVDFSSLNNQKKSISEVGESGDTFRAIRDYAEKYRPKLVILENIKGAPWKDIRDKYMMQIGYVAEYSLVDTKNYYIPHTRVRGYMIWVDARSHHGPDGKHNITMKPEDLPSILSTWKKTLKAFERQASCSVEAFLLDEDDPHIIRVRDEIEENGNKASWERCRARHEDYRKRMCLGQKRPLTKWIDGGSCKPLDYMWQNWTLSQVERVLDTIDIAWLRNLNRGFDHQYKARILELSQNLDRDEDTAKFGLTGCITPSGIPYNTIRGGPLIGLETLALQGLPINKLQLTRENQSQLQDLAGNAMTSTVVGPAILAALIAGYQTLLPGTDCAMHADTPLFLSKHIGEDCLIPFNLDLAAYKPISVDKVLDFAAKSFRFCLCEGPTMVSTTTLQQCNLCKHTSCVKCGGNPKHQYAPMEREFVSERISPSIFEDHIKKSIPMEFTFSTVLEASFKHLEQNEEDNVDSKLRSEMVNAIRKAFSSVLRFCLAKRSEVWTISYDSKHASMELVLSSEKAEWRLYAKASPTKPANSKIRELLSRPIARMRPKGEDIVKGQWQLWLPRVYEFGATVQGGDALIPSFESVHGIGKFADTEVWDELTILIPSEASERLDEDISGSYKLLQDCGTASGSLHVQTKTPTSRAPIFLFLDPHRIHHPNDDSFVFTSDKRRLNYGETRPLVARFHSSWRPQKLKSAEANSSDNIAEYTVDGSEKLITLSEARRPINVKCYVDGQWVNLPKVTFNSRVGERISFHRAPPNLSISPSANSCQVAHVFLNCEGSIPDSGHCVWQLDKWIEVPSIDYEEFFAAFTWLIGKASVLLGLDEWKEVKGPHARCHDCTPYSPDIKWRLETRDQSSKLIPFEDPGQAASFERKVKNRPAPLVTQIYIDKAGLVRLRLAANPETLMHRALGKFIALEGGSEVLLSWRLCAGLATPSSRLPAFQIANNDRDPEASKPPGFTRDLRPEQSRSLSWMIRQEACEVEPFNEEEIEEATIPQIGWRVEGRASKPIFVRGGVLADHVGYGKTAITLALIDTQRGRDRKAAKDPVKGRIALKATIIFVPSHLPEQWKEEIEKFLDDKKRYNVLVINFLKDLVKMTIAQFQSADIILVSFKVCDTDGYMLNIAQFAGMLELQNSPRRAAATWYKHALEEISEHVDNLQGGGRELKALLSRKLTEWEEKATAEGTVVPYTRPLIRLRGKAYLKAKQDQATSTKRKHTMAFPDEPEGVNNLHAEGGSVAEPRKAGSDIFGLGEIAKGNKNWTDMKCPLFELFEFARVVLDEYTYVAGQESLPISNLKAKSRWILSATPKLRDFTDVNCMSKLLGITLGVDDLTPGRTEATNIKTLEKEKTAEMFHSYRSSQSVAWHKRRHVVAQAFLDRFVRRNVPDIEEISSALHVRPVILPAVERAIYLELNQFLARNDFNMQNMRGSADNDRNRRIREVLDESKSAGEALMKCASQFTLDRTRNEFENRPEASDIILEFRISHYGSLRADFKKKLKQAESLKRICSVDVRQYRQWKRDVHNNQFGDGESTDEINSMIKAAEIGYEKDNRTEFGIPHAQKADTMRVKIIAAANSANAKERKGKGSKSRGENGRITMKGRGKTVAGCTDSNADMAIGEDSEFCEEAESDDQLKPEGVGENGKMELALRDVTNDLRKLSTELVSSRRCLRFFECVRNLQGLYTNLRKSKLLAKEFSCSKCEKSHLLPESFSILAECGHTICNECLETHMDWQDDECLELKCNAVNQTYQVVKASDLGVEDDRTRVGQHCGKKLEDIIHLIEKIPQNDQVLLFVQFVDLIKKIKCALKENEITYLVLAESTDRAKALVKFQGDQSSTKTKVLVLNIGDESAAGSNLANCNHVIFVSPFLSDSQADYDQAMTQAIGRACRYGQTKPVHIYHFLSLKTIDVDALQFRTKMILAENAEQPPEFIPFKSFVPSTFGLVKDQPGGKGQFGLMEADELFSDA